MSWQSPFRHQKCCAQQARRDPAHLLSQLATLICQNCCAEHVTCQPFRPWGLANEGRIPALIPLAAKYRLRGPAAICMPDGPFSLCTGTGWQMAHLTHVGADPLSSGKGLKALAIEDPEDTIHLPVYCRNINEPFLQPSYRSLDIRPGMLPFNMYRATLLSLNWACGLLT